MEQRLGVVDGKEYVFVLKHRTLPFYYGIARTGSDYPDIGWVHENVITWLDEVDQNV